MSLVTLRLHSDYGYSDKEVSIMTHQIETFYRSQYRSYTVVELLSGKSYCVLQSPNEITKLIKEANE